MTLIERLKQTNQFHDNADVSTQEVVAAIQALQAENERLREMYAGLKKMVDDGSINERTYSAGIELERLNTELRAERDALAVKLATLEADAERYRWLRNTSQISASSTGKGIAFPHYVTSEMRRCELDAAIDAAKGGQQ